jgi:hypothetical protein
LTSSTLTPLITDRAEEKCIEVAFTLADFEVWASTPFETNASKCHRDNGQRDEYEEEKGRRKKKEGRKGES